MKICFFSHHSISGKDGASLSMINIAEELAERGNEVYIIYSNRAENVSHHAHVTNIYFRNFSMRKSLNDTSIVSLIEYRFKEIYNNIVCFVLKKKLRKLNIDLVHINGIDNNIGATIAILLNIPFVWHIRQFLEEDLNCTLFNKEKTYKLMKKANCVIGISKAVCNKYEKILKRKVELIYNGVEPNVYTLPEHAFQNKPYCIILPGRITKEKGQLDAVKAVKKILEKGFDIRLKIVGYGIDDYYNVVKKYVIENNLSEKIEFIQYTNNLSNIRKHSDIGLVCSTKEAFGRITIENFFSRIICIGANSGGTAEIIRNNQNGLLYESGNINDLVNKIEFLICDDNKIAIQNMINRAYEDALEIFSTERLINQIICIYKSILL